MKNKYLLLSIFLMQAAPLWAMDADSYDDKFYNGLSKNPNLKSDTFSKPKRNFKPLERLTKYRSPRTPFAISNAHGLVESNDNLSLTPFFLQPLDPNDSHRMTFSLEQQSIPLEPTYSHEDSLFSEIIREISQVNTPLSYEHITFCFHAPQDHNFFQPSKKNNSGGKRVSTINRHVVYSPYGRPIGLNDENICSRRFLIAREQEREGQHDLANFNYNLSFEIGEYVYKDR